MSASVASRDMNARVGRWIFHRWLSLIGTLLALYAAVRLEDRAGSGLALLVMAMNTVGLTYWWSRPEPGGAPDERMRELPMTASPRLDALHAAVSSLSNRNRRGEPCECGLVSGHAGWLTCAESLADAYFGMTPNTGEAQR